MSLQSLLKVSDCTLLMILYLDLVQGLGKYFNLVNLLIKSQLGDTAGKKIGQVSRVWKLKGRLKLNNSGIRFSRTCCPWGLGHKEARVAGWEHHGTTKKETRKLENSRGMSAREDDGLGF